MPQRMDQFRNDIRNFCNRNIPADLREKTKFNLNLDKEDYVQWQKILRKQGWFGGHWPLEYGGLGWSKLQQWIFEDELAFQGAPWTTPFGVTYVGPVIYTFGNEDQKEKYLQPILNSDIWWAQCYSEPNAGSDLAGLKTSAIRDGDTYVISGQKTWTTMAHWADMAFVLARTDPAAPQQKGISFFLVDLSSPGVTVRPIETIDRCHEVNEVFFDDVRVPAENLVGEENKGWRYAKFLLSQERLLVAEVGKARRMVADILALARKTGGEGGVANDRGWRQSLVDIEIDIAGLEALCLDLLGQAEAGSEPGPEASLLKIVGSELMQRISSCKLDLLARHGLAYHVSALSAGVPDVLIEGAAGSIRDYLHGRALTIYGGSNEIQRNIIAKAVLEL